MTGYAEFIAEKAIKIERATIPARVTDEWLFPWQRKVVDLCLERGRYCIFADTGLGKTRMQLAFAREVQRHTGGRVLILAPLAVGFQTCAEAERIGVDAKHVREVAEVGEHGIYVTNYERLERFAAMEWAGLVLDESSILKNLEGIIRRQIQEVADGIPYRLACSATPAPNDPIEYSTHSSFVGAMSQHEIMAVFFFRDHTGGAGGRDEWKLRKHARLPWFRYLNEIAIAFRKPSDLGEYDDSGYILPPPLVTFHEVEAAEQVAEGMLFPVVASTLSERRQAKRESISERVELVRDLVEREPNERWIVWCHLNAESDALAEALPHDAVEIRGSDSQEAKEAALLGFARGEIRILITKPSIAGHGMNFQRCARMAFVGLDDSFEGFYQAVRRCHRFGQTRQVNVHIVSAKRERAVLSNIRRKQKETDAMMDGMIDEMGALRFGRDWKATVEHESAEGEGWRLILGDSAEELPKLAESSIGLSVYSPPFPGMYLYSNTPHDVGNCRTIESLIEHSRYIMGEPLLRVTMPGRLTAVHMMQLPMLKGVDGEVGIKDWRGPLIAMMIDEGWIYHGEVTIDKNPQAQATRLKVHQLLFKTLARDSSHLRMALADYVIFFRKPGENPEPIRAGIHKGYNGDGGWVTQEEWIEWAAPVWYGSHRGIKGGIAEGDVLDPRTGRDQDDERHLAPLQLGVIERCVKLFSNPGDLVLSPFAGIGSEGYVAIKAERRFLGIELKRSYYEAAKRNLAQAVHETRGLDLFAESAE